MQTRVYKLYASVAADTNAAAQLVFQRPGLITAVAGHGSLSGTANGDFGCSELSFASTIQNQTNDPIGPIALFYVLKNLVTSGGFDSVVNYTLSGLAIPVDQGVRIYCHSDIAGTVTFLQTWFIHVLENG